MLQLLNPSRKSFGLHCSFMKAASIIDIFFYV